MDPNYNLTYVALSVLVAILASYVALNLASSILEAKGRAKLLWLSLGSFAMGMGIWSMHFIGMDAFEMPGMTMAYDLPLTILSMLIAILGSAIALFVVGQRSHTTQLLLASGCAMAAAIAGMHYTGMYSMRMAAVIQWNMGLVLLSILIALAASFAALYIKIRLRENAFKYGKIIAAIVMGFAIAGMHYTGMFAATFVHSSENQISGSNLLASETLNVAVLISTFLILGLALLGVAMDRVLRNKTKKAQEFEDLLNQASFAITKLEEERALRERFVFALAHDLRTPLTAATMVTQMALRNMKNSEAEESISKAVENLKQMDSMIQDLLDVHRVSAGELLSIDRQKCDVAKLLHGVLDSMKLIHGDRFILQSSVSVIAEWDEKSIRRVIENLCSNAVKYGDENHKIKISADVTPQNSVVISVNNQGPPLAAEDHEKIFALFKRGEVGRSKRGWGIGLTIVKGLIEAHGGKVSVESNANAGTTFTIEVPCYP